MGDWLVWLGWVNVVAPGLHRDTFGVVSLGRLELFSCCRLAIKKGWVCLAVLALGFVAGLLSGFVSGFWRGVGKPAG